MAPLRAGRPLKRWRYLGVYRSDLMLCMGDARVAGVPQRWWAVALPDGTLIEGSRGVELSAGRARGARCARRWSSTSPTAWRSSRRTALVHLDAQACAGARARARERRRADWELDGDDGFVDESAGYHARHTAWRWSAGVGRTDDGRAVAWNLVDGVHDAPSSSERTVWVDGEPHEVAPQEFADDLSSVGGLRFREWSARESRMNLLLMRNSYRQPFGEFSGELPGGLRLAEGHGVMEEHDVRW